MATLIPYDTIQTAAQKVADLWAEQLVKPTNKDNGDDNPMLFLLATHNTIHAQQSLDAVKLQNFKTALILLIGQEILGEWPQSANYYHHITTDYGPEGLLAQAAEQAQIPGGCFPWKSCTRIHLNDNLIDYRFGYSCQWANLKIDEQ